MRRAGLLAAGAGLLFLAAGAGPAARKPGKTAFTNPGQRPLGPLYGSVKLEWSSHDSNSGTDYDDQGRPKVQWTETLNGRLKVEIHFDGKAGERKSPDGRVTVIQAAGTAGFDYDETWHIDKTHLDSGELEWEEVHSEAAGQPAALGRAPSDSRCSAFLIGDFPKPVKGRRDPTAPMEIHCLANGMRVRTVSTDSRSKDPPKPVELPLPGISIPGKPEAGVQSWEVLRGNAKKLGDEIRTDGSFPEPTVGHWWESHYIAAGKAGVYADRPEMTEAIKRMPMLADAIKQMQAAAAAAEAKTKSKGPGQEYGYGGPFRGNLQVTWHVSTEEYEVVVDSEESGEYEKWRPEGSTSSSAGNLLGLRAKLQRRGGRPPELLAKKFLFELEKVSREPGISMNYPSRAGDHDPDLRFEKNGYPETRTVDPEGQKAETTGSPRTEGRVLLGSYDWGGWGELKVTALLTNGRKIVGHWKDDVEKTQVLLPKRKDDSQIADVWKKDHGVENLPDNDDKDPSPKSNPLFVGDGLTLYEEYRGFYENGKHVEGDPKRKDLFIRNKIGGRGEPGIALFGTLTGIVPHAELRDGELPPSRVINGNHAEGKHNKDQHALVIEMTPASRDYAEAQNGPGPPASVTKILVPEKWHYWDGLTDSDVVDDLASVVAHELLHGCNVRHHGGGDFRVRWSKRGNEIVEAEVDDKGRQKGSAISIVVEDEDGRAVSADEYAKPVTLWLGRKHGQHSGNMDCVMRYYVAKAYEGGFASPLEGFRRIRIGKPEKPGLDLCDSPQATGEAVRRYGDAVLPAGLCRYQLCVNDAACN